MADDQQISDLIAKLQSEGKLPKSLGARQIELLTRSLAKYSSEVSERLQEKILEEYKSRIGDSMSGTIPEPNRGVIADLTQFIGSPEIADMIRASLDISTEVASGGGRYLNQLMAVDAYPCWELKRMFGRQVPRGFMRGPKGTLVPVPDDDWPSRWEAAGGEFYGDNRMIARVDDEVWQNLGDGDGDYDDALGNPFPPFAFNSGFMTFDISRKEAVELGVIDEDEKVEAPKIDFANFFSFTK